MLVIVEAEQRVEEASLAIRGAVEGVVKPELLICRFKAGGADRQALCDPNQAGNRGEKTNLGIRPVRAIYHANNSRFSPLSLL